MTIPLSRSGSKRSRTGRFRPPSRGFTLLEMVVVMLIFLLIGVTLSYLVVVSAKMGKDALETVRTESQARNAMNAIRQHLLVAAAASIVISDNGRTITYTDPTPQKQLVDTNGDPVFFSDGTPVMVSDTPLTSAMTFQTLTYVDAQGNAHTEKLLAYKPNANSTDTSTYTLYHGLSDVVFTLDAASGTMLKVQVTAIGRGVANTSNWNGTVSGTRNSPITLTDTILFRNY